MDRAARKPEFWAGEGITGCDRRQVLAGALALGGLSVLALSPAGPARLYRWQGPALGARAAITLNLPDPVEAAPIVADLVSEIDRLEDIFSLYRSGSELSRLNRQGRLTAPSPELLDLLSLARRFSRLTDGAFDVTVQPLWEIHRDGRAGDASVLQAARTLVDYRAVSFDRREIRFGRPGMRITLNGIAQGYISDRIAARLGDAGLASALVSLGEIRALGGHPGGRPWTIGLAGHGDRNARLPLASAGVATSSRRGLVFGGEDGAHHIFDPAMGTSARGIESVTVRAGDATTADALSTALMVAPLDRLRERLAVLAPLAVRITGQDGRTRRWTVAA